MANFVWINEKRGHLEFFLENRNFYKLPEQNRNFSGICLENWMFFYLVPRPPRFQTRLRRNANVIDGLTTEQEVKMKRII